MPVDNQFDDDEKPDDLNKGFREFDCPSCNANNPIEFEDGDELICNYCGNEYTVQVRDDGRFKLRER